MYGVGITYFCMHSSRILIHYLIPLILILKLLGISINQKILYEWYRPPLLNRSNGADLWALFYSNEFNWLHVYMAMRPLLKKWQVSTQQSHPLFFKNEQSSQHDECSCVKFISIYGITQMELQCNSYCESSSRCTDSLLILIWVWGIITDFQWVVFLKKSITKPLCHVRLVYTGQYWQTAWGVINMNFAYFTSNFLSAAIPYLLFTWLTSKIPYSTLIWRSFILAIGDLKSKSPLLKLPIINVHAHSNTRVYQIAKLKTANYIFMENHQNKVPQI